MKYSNIILLSDLDGTLLNAQSEVSEENKKAIEYFVANGGRFGVATGRAKKNALGILQGIPLNYYSIFLNGALLYDGVSDKNVEVDILEKEKLIPLIKRCLVNCPSVGILVYLEDEAYFVSPKELSPSKLIAEGKLEGDFAKLDTIRDEKWTKVLFHGELEELKQVEEEAKDVLEEIVDGIYTTTNYFETGVCTVADYYELLPKGCNKGKRIKSIHQVKSDQDVIYAIGDLYNDVEMIEVADVGIYTENAPEDLKKKVKRICANHNNHAMVDVIERIIEEDLSLARPS